LYIAEAVAALQFAGDHFANPFQLEGAMPEGTVTKDDDNHTRVDLGSLILYGHLEAYQ
jgi:hypothetical protein